jgi:peptidoglycan/LPS O-acetylase OafA/YrhL
MLAGFFAAGAFLQYMTAGRREVLRMDVAALVLAAIPTAVALLPHYAVAIAGALLPYAVITVALASTPVLRRAARWGDFSYGLYLWAFPVQQIVVHLFGPLPMYVNLPLVFAPSLALAVASWRFVERPTMALRGRTRSARPTAGRLPATHATAQAAAAGFLRHDDSPRGRVTNPDHAA